LLVVLGQGTLNLLDNRLVVTSGSLTRRSKFHFALSWSRYLDKQNKYGPNFKKSAKLNKKDSRNRKTWKYALTEYGRKKF